MKKFTILMEPEVPNRHHKCLHLAPILIQFYSVCNFAAHFSNVCIYFILPTEPLIQRMLGVLKPESKAAGA